MINAYRRNKKLALPFLVPSLIIYTVFFIVPAISGFLYSFFDWRGFSKDKTFIGLKNFKELFKDKIFWNCLLVNLKIMIIGGIVIFALAFLFMIMYRNIKRFRNSLRALIFLPYIISPIAICILWSFVLNQRFGLLNNMLFICHFDSLIRPWLDSDHILGSLLFVIIWTYVGFYFVILVSGISKIPDSVYESALLEGANSFQTFTHITIPMIWDVLTVAIVYWMIQALKMFELPYSFTGFKPRMEIWNLSVYIYTLGFGKNEAIYRIGYAAGVSVMLSVMVMLFVTISRNVMRRDSIEY